MTSYQVIKGGLVSTENYTWNTADTLGKGASAVVYLGRKKVQGTYVAVKVFHDRVHQGYKTEDMRELELLRQLNHPNVIKMLDIEKINSTSKSVIIMEYCEGGSLHSMLDQPQYYYGLSEEEFLLVLYHVCDGMEYLQRMNVIHRDIKPGNIMRSVTEDGFSMYKLTDFGAARNLYEDESFQSLYGTEEYLHPGMYERAVLKLPNSQMFDAKVDLWSLGVTFYHTATGQLPFQPYGGRSNKRTMFEIITQKESGVISGVQNSDGGPIIWRRDLPETSPLSSGLKSVIIPLLVGLMEPDASKMITHQSLFRMVSNIRQKLVIIVFHYNRCEELKIFADSKTTLSGLQDEIARLTDIVAADQILIIDGRSLEELVNPLSPLEEYPSHFLNGSIYLFQKEMNEVNKIAKPEIPPLPDFMLTNMDTDTRLAHSYTSWGELIRRNQEKVILHQERLVNGLFFLRLYVESRLESTKVSFDSVKQLTVECKFHITTFFNMVKLLYDFIVARKGGQCREAVLLISFLEDSVVIPVHDKASERMIEIEKYRSMLAQKLQDIKEYASKYTAECPETKCVKKIQHHLSVITGVYGRFRRDKSVKNQMTSHDENIHRFEGQKLHDHCLTMRSIFTDHCLQKLSVVYKNSVHLCESLTKCLARVVKIEKNIASVQKCQNLLSEKLISFRTTCVNELERFKDAEAESAVPSKGDSAFHELDTGITEGLATAETRGSLVAATAEMRPASSVDSLRGAENRPEGMMSMSDQVAKLEDKLRFIRQLMDENTNLLQCLEETALESSGSLSQRPMNQARRDNT